MQAPARRQKPKSVPLALGLSAVLPGAGQAYNGQWVKAAVMLGLEAAVITGTVAWNNQGQNLEADYQEYAHQFWSPTKYADWLNDYSLFIQDSFGANVTAPAVVVPQNINFQAPNTWSDQEWMMVQEFFVQIQDLERQMFHVETQAVFSHTLPHFSEQQYYELVGKYYQFAPGWSDYPEWREGDGYTAAIDPSMTGPNDTKPNVSDRFFQYADDHAYANDVLRRASRVSMLLIVTHFAGAIDAAVSAKLHNQRITPQIRMQVDAEGRPQPVASLRVKL